MEWQVVKVKNGSGKNVPFVSIGRGQLDFNAVACELIGDEGSYKYAQFLMGKDKGKPVIAVKFLNEYEEDSVPITRKVQKEKIIAGMTVRNKGIVEELFGKDGANDGMVRHSVERVSDNILKILD
ncbi:hypothetical protein SAMN02910339_02458 [Lachnospiraceae bacterium YSD2013]|nr:hypothetical protein SAMN02910339_02458 [Lachnospiraceae bacterium YSD2013]